MYTDKLVVVTAEQAEALNDIEEKVDSGIVGGVFNSYLTIIKYRMEGNSFCDSRASANELTVEELITAFTEGYKVVQTPEDRAKAIIDKVLADAEREQYCLDLYCSEEEDKAFCEGIIKGIKLLKQEGIKFSVEA